MCKIAEIQYYRDQIKEIEKDKEIKVQFQSEYSSTKWLSLNDESAQEIIRFLRSKFNVI
jgi:hypothetical protein